MTQDYRIGTCPARQFAARLLRRAWQRYSAGEGAKGHRCYDWAWLAIGPGRPGHRWLLIRRNRRTRKLAFYQCFSPRHVPLPALVKIAGTRWVTEENFQAGKGLAGLDEHQVRRWASWYRWEIRTPSINVDRISRLIHRTARRLYVLH